VKKDKNVRPEGDVVSDHVEQPLPGGADNYGAVVRVGDTVRRPLRSFSPAVHLLLKHLEAVDFRGAPRFRGIDEAGREILTYIPGDVALAPLPPWSRSERTVESVAALLADYHAAVASFRWPPDTPWNSYVEPPWNQGPLLCHNDLGRSNVVCRDGLAIAFIDFDRAAPARLEWELACAVQQWIPLRGEEDDPDVAGPRTARRIRRFCDVYGLTSASQRHAVLDAIRDSEAASLRMLEARVAEGHPAYVRFWKEGAADRIEARRLWLNHHRETLRSALD
jgi:hypothetical protein